MIDHEKVAKCNISQPQDTLPNSIRFLKRVGTQMQSTTNSLSACVGEGEFFQEIWNKMSNAQLLL
jgi:hypothetical protein